MTVQPLYLQLSQAADRVASKRVEIDPRRVALVFAVALPFALGWLLGTTKRATWAVLSWLWAAAVVGYQASQTGGATNRSDARGGG